jgi:hypothetical protein
MALGQGEAGGMISALTEWKDRLLGRGAASITVPVFDGALKSNRIVEDAQIVATLDAPEDLASDGESVFVADGPRLLRLDETGFTEIARFEAPITALACLGRGAFAVALSGREVRIQGGAHDGRRWDAVAGESLHAINAIGVAADGRLLVTDASREHTCERWKHDLMGLGRSGRVLELTPSDGGARVLAVGFAYAFGAGEVAGKLWASESWRHHVVQLEANGAHRVVTDALPGYPSRIAPATGGGAWLTCFALRTQLVEFVLREHRYRKRMMAEIDPAYWIAPALSSGNSFLEPMQGAQLKMMGIVKPWAPPRSYGLVVRLTDAGLVRYSLHSRFDGRNHGIVAAAECRGKLFLLAKGSKRVLSVTIAAAERELSQ